MSVTSELDALIEQLDEALEAGNSKSTTIGEPQSITHSEDADALDVIFETPSRQTELRRLRDSQVIRQFREELLNGLVRVDQLNQVLKLLAFAVNQVLKL